MDRAYPTILALVAIGVAYAFFHKKKSAPKNNVSGWFGLGIIGFLLLGLVLAGVSGHETLCWFFGLALMVTIPAMFFLAMGAGIVGLFHHGDEKDEQIQEKPPRQI